jgi:hypothetical protein
MVSCHFLDQSARRLILNCKRSASLLVCTNTVKFDIICVKFTYNTVIK